MNEAIHDSMKNDIYIYLMILRVKDCKTIVHAGRQTGDEKKRRQMT